MTDTVIPAPPSGAIAQDIDRLTCILMVRHEHGGDDPKSIDCRYSALLETKEQMYSRRLKVGQNWVEIETGWVNSPGLLVIQNHPTKFATNPTKEQRDEDQKRFLEISYDGNKPWLVSPGRFFVAQPSDLAGCKMRCVQGTAEITISAIPQ